MKLIRPVLMTRWGFRTYLAVRAAKAITEASNRPYAENKVLLGEHFRELEEFLMASFLSRSPGASIHPSGQTERNKTRAAAPSAARRAMTAVLGSVGTDVLPIGDYVIKQNEAGALVVVAPTGSETVVVDAPSEPVEIDGETTSTVETGPDGTADEPEEITPAVVEDTPDKPATPTTSAAAGEDAGKPAETSPGTKPSNTAPAGDNTKNDTNTTGKTSKTDSSKTTEGHTGSEPIAPPAPTTTMFTR